MQRRQFVTGSIITLALAAVPSLAHARNRKFVFKIKTKAGGIVGNLIDRTQYLLPTVVGVFPRQE